MSKHLTQLVTLSGVFHTVPLIRYRVLSAGDGIRHHFNHSYRFSLSKRLWYAYRAIGGTAGMWVRRAAARIHLLISAHLVPPVCLVRGWVVVVVVVAVKEGEGELVEMDVTKGR